MLVASGAAAGQHQREEVAGSHLLGSHQQSCHDLPGCHCCCCCCLLA
jgi:hypothetical protein